jgi:hypothetical protein
VWERQKFSKVSSVVTVYSKDVRALTLRISDSRSWRSSCGCGWCRNSRQTNQRGTYTCVCVCMYTLCMCVYMCIHLCVCSVCMGVCVCACIQSSLWLWMESQHLAASSRARPQTHVHTQTHTESCLHHNISPSSTGTAPNDRARGDASRIKVRGFAKWQERRVCCLITPATPS